MSVRNYAILYGGVRRVSSGGASIGGGNALLSTEQHDILGQEHTSFSGESTDMLLGSRDFMGIGEIEQGTLTVDGAPFTVSSGSTYRAFPGDAWLTKPAASEHTVGDTLLKVYRDGDDHLVNGKIVGEIGTVTATDPWTYTLGSQFDIENVANDLRCEDAVSVLDIDGEGDYRAVIVAREYNGTINLSSHILISDVASDAVTSGSAWTRHEVTNSTGSTQSAPSGRCLRLANGTFLIGAQWYSGATNVSGVLIVDSITDWSAPNAVTIASGYNENCIIEVSPGTLIAHLRNTAQTGHYSSTSTDSGLTWSAPTLLYAAMGLPTWRLLASGLGVTAYRSFDGSMDTAWRQTTAGVTDTGWGSETILDSTGSASEYATILQLDDTNALITYAVEVASGDADIYSQVVTDSSVFAPARAILVDRFDPTPGFLLEKVVAGEGISLTRLADDRVQFSGVGVAASGAAADVTVADSGGYYVGTDVEAVLAELGVTRASATGQILISDTPAGSPLVFADLIQNEAEDDLVYADLA